MRWAGGLLIGAGTLLLIYAFSVTMMESSREMAAEALVPGQGLETAVPISTQTEPREFAAVTEVRVQATPLATPTLLSPLLYQSKSSFTPAIEKPEIAEVVGPRGLARGEGAQPARLIIPRLRLDTRVEEATWAFVQEFGTSMSEWQIPYNAVGHLSTTAMPGEAGNTVISGHHNLTGPDEFGLGKFAGLWNLRVGDPVYIFDNLGRVFLYRVADHYVLLEEGQPLSVREEHAKQIVRDTGAAIATFETCWNGSQAPLSGNTYRWIVVANLIGSIKPIQVPRSVN